MAVVDSCTNVDIDFATTWSSAVVGERFPDLQQVCGYFASRFPYTASGQSEFSVIGWETDKFQNA
jgi:hypothetical protein